MPTLDITQSYSDTNALTEAQLDAIRTSLQTFINTTGIDEDNIEDLAITTTLIASSAVETAKIADDAVTAAKIVDNIILPGNCGVTISLQVGTSGPVLKQLSGSTRTVTVGPSGGTQLPMVVSAIPTTRGLKIVKGTLSSDGTILAGEGFTVSHSSVLDSYTITFSSAFLTAPTITAVPTEAGSRQPHIVSVSTTAFELEMYSLNAVAGGGTANGFSFIAIGERNL